MQEKDETAEKTFNLISSRQIFNFDFLNLCIYTFR